MMELRRNSSKAWRVVFRLLHHSSWRSHENGGLVSYKGHTRRKEDRHEGQNVAESQQG